MTTKTELDHLEQILEYLRIQTNVDKDKKWVWWHNSLEKAIMKITGLLIQERQAKSITIKKWMHKLDRNDPLANKLYMILEAMDDNNSVDSVLYLASDLDNDDCVDAYRKGKKENPVSKRIKELEKHRKHLSTPANVLLNILEQATQGAPTEQLIELLQDRLDTEYDEGWSDAKDKEQKNEN